MKLAASFLAVLAAIACAVVPAALAQEPDEEEFEGIPAYSVARVKVLAGSVWVRSSEGGDWEEYPTNSPVTARNRVSVPEGAEAELQFHGGQFVLLTAGTDLEARELQESKTTFRLRAGEIRFDLPEEDFAPVTVRFPGGGSADFPEPGRYWLTVTGNAETRVVVRRGNAKIVHDGGEYRLRADEVATVDGEVTIGPLVAAPAETPQPAPLTEAESVAPVPQAVNYELREYGEWVYVNPYGWVWRPQAASGWSPYTYGRWSWNASFGWTWVSYEPWGWYPYRCGYWVTDPFFGWVWSPYGSFVSVGFTFGGHYYHHYHRNVRYVPSNVRFIPAGRDVRWVPLQPGERYRRPAIARGDARLAGTSRPLESGRVFVRSPDRKEWRDATVVRTEREKAVRQSISERPRPDARKVRPELYQGRPPATERTRQRSTTQPAGKAPAVKPPAARTGETPAARPREGPVKQGKPDYERQVPRGGTAPREQQAPRTVTPPREQQVPRTVTPPREQQAPRSVPPPREQRPQTVEPGAGTQSAPRPPALPPSRQVVPLYRPPVQEPAVVPRGGDVRTAPERPSVGGTPEREAPARERGDDGGGRGGGSGDSGGGRGGGSGGGRTR